MSYYTRGETLDVTGAREVAAQLREIGASQDVVDEVFRAHGADVVRAAQGLAPQRTGKLRSAISTSFTSPGRLTVTAGSNMAPHAYTYHSGVVGKPVTSMTGGDLAPKTSGGYMVFRVPRHTRRGYQVTGYSALRKITLNPYLFAAWNRLQASLVTKIEQALAGMWT